MADDAGDPKQPLPPHYFHLGPVSSAYRHCLDRETAASNDETRMYTYARVLGYLLCYALDEAGQTATAEKIIGDEDITKLDNLALFYIDYLLRRFRRHGRVATPHSSDHLGYESFNQSTTYVSEPSQEHMTHTAAKKLALRRDSNRCMVSGYVETKVVEIMPHHERQPSGLTPLIRTFVTYFLLPRTQVRRRFMTRDFGQIDVIQDLGAQGFHCLKNGLTMHMVLHAQFSKLRMWFEHEGAHTYRICSVIPGSINAIIPADGRVTFRSTVADLELPDPRYLKLHAAVCQVAHLSGGAEYLELESQKHEEPIPVLAQDGSSAPDLIHRLHEAALFT